MTLPTERDETEIKLHDLPMQKLRPLIELYNQGKFQKIVDQATKPPQNFPNSVTLYNLSGSANNGLGRLKDAVVSFEKDHV